MRCSKARKLISDYLDDYLDEKQILTLKKHLERCPACQKVLKDFQSITEKSKELEKLFPSPQTWFKIMSKLRTEEQQVTAHQPLRKEWFSFLFSPGKLRYAFSTALVLAIVIGIVIVGPRFWRGKEVLRRDDRQGYTLAKLDEAERHYQLAIKALMEAVSAQEGKINPQTAEVLRKNLEIIDFSIVACQQAVHREPDNIEVRNYLLAAYMEKVNLLNMMVDIEKKSLRKEGLEKTL